MYNSDPQRESEGRYSRLEGLLSEASHSGEETGILGLECDGKGLEIAPVNFFAGWHLLPTKDKDNMYNIVEEKLAEARGVSEEMYERLKDEYKRELIEGTSFPQPSSPPPPTSTPHNNNPENQTSRETLSGAIDPWGPDLARENSEINAAALWRNA